MPKIIAFYGSPGSGKTSIALKTAMETYIQTKDEIIAFLSPDMTVPSVALLFPNYAPDEVVSLSEIFDNTAITNESLLKNGVTVKNMKDFFALGFKAGENRYSFPTPTPEKINSLFSALSDVAGYIFVDCTNDEGDEISKKALAIADAVVRIITPDLKGNLTSTNGGTVNRYAYTNASSYTVLLNIILTEQSRLHFVRLALTVPATSIYTALMITLYVSFSMKKAKKQAKMNSLKTLTLLFIQAKK